VNSAIILASEAGGSSGLPWWAFGLIGFGILMLALFIVTRFNPDR
jgi:hypothetical protein